MNLLEQTHELVVCDTETADRWDDAVVFSAAFTHGDLRQRYTLEQLVEERTFFFKFNAREQLKAGRKTCKSVIEWWKSDKVSEVARIMSLYSSEVNDKPMAEFRDAYVTWCHKMMLEPKNIIHCDRNLFDLRKLQHIIEVTLGGYADEPWDYHNIIDVTSTLRAWGADRYAGVDARTLPGMIYHDPRYDAALDWLRMQATAVNAGLLELNE